MLSSFKDMEEDCYGGIGTSISTTHNTGGMQMTYNPNDFKNDYSKNAYMLIYEKRRKEQIKMVISEELIQKR